MHDSMHDDSMYAYSDDVGMGSMGSTMRDHDIGMDRRKRHRSAHSHPHHNHNRHTPTHGQDHQHGLMYAKPTRYGSLDSYVNQESMLHPGQSEAGGCRFWRSCWFCCSWNVPVVLQPVCQPCECEQMDRAVSHCLFCMQFFGWCCILSLPRLSCLVDLIVSLALYLGPMRGSLSVEDYLVKEAVEYDIGHSCFLVVLLAVTRAVLLFFVFAERRREWTISVSSVFLASTVGFVGTKMLIFRSTRKLYGLLTFQITIASLEYVLYWLVGRRRVVIQGLLTERLSETGPTLGYSGVDLTNPISLLPQHDSMLNAIGAKALSSEQRQRLSGCVSVDSIKDEDSNFVSVGEADVQIHYKLEHGDSKTGENLILLHDFGLGVFSWKSCWPHLLKKHKTVVAFDFPGFGLSERPSEWASGVDNPYQEDFWLKILHKIMHIARMQKAVLVGHGMGGAVAMIAASKMPTRIKRIVAVAPTIYREYTPNSVKPFLHTPSLLRTYFSKIQEQSFFDRKRITNDTIQKINKILEVSNWEFGIQQINKLTRRYSVKAILPSLRCGVTIIHGREDKIVPMSDSELAIKNIPTNNSQNKTIIKLEKCGHVPQEELPEDFAAAVTEQHGGGGALVVDMPPLSAM